MTTPSWESLLKELSEIQLRVHDFNYIENRGQIYTEAKRKGTLSMPPASPLEIEQAEYRLGAVLPESYRQFLLTSNGWGPIDQFIWRMLPIQEVMWCKDGKPSLVEGWLEAERSANPQPERVPDKYYLLYGKDQSAQDIRPEYLETALQISEIGDAAMILLNPFIQTADGEWEAWRFDVKQPGATRYRSFYELMEAELETARKLGSEPEKSVQSIPRSPGSGNGPDKPSN